MPLGKDNRSPSQVTRDSGGGVAEMGGETSFSQSVPPLGEDFWGWRDKQLADGTVIWTLPSGQTYVTSPGSAILFPALMVPTGELPKPTTTPDDRRGERTAMMPTRRRTRAQQRSQRITAERNRNRNDRLTRQRAYTDARAAPDDEPPPF